MIKRGLLAFILLGVMYASANATDFTDTDLMYGWDGSAQFYQTWLDHKAQLGLLFEPLKGADDNFVSDAELAVLQNTSGNNTGDQQITEFTLNGNIIQLTLEGDAGGQQTADLSGLLNAKQNQDELLDEVASMSINPTADRLIFFDDSYDPGFGTLGGLRWLQFSDELRINDVVLGLNYSVTTKTTPVGGDYILLFDSEDTNNVKKSPVSSLPLPTKITGSVSLDTASIASGACTNVTDTATGAIAGDVLLPTWATDPTGVTGWSPSASGGLYLDWYVTADTVNFEVCNNTDAAIDPGAITMNYLIIR